MLEERGSETGDPSEPARPVSRRRKRLTAPRAAGEKEAALVLVRIAREMVTMLMNLIRARVERRRTMAMVGAVGMREKRVPRMKTHRAMPRHTTTAVLSAIDVGSCCAVMDVPAHTTLRV